MAVINNSHVTLSYSDTLYYGFTRDCVHFCENEDYEDIGFSDVVLHYHSEYIYNLYEDNITWIMALIAENIDYPDDSLSNNFDDFLDTGEACEIPASDGVIKFLLGQSILITDYFTDFVTTTQEENLDTKNRFGSVIDYVDDNIFNVWSKILKQISKENSVINLDKTKKNLHTKFAEVYLYCNPDMSMEHFNNLLFTFPTLATEFTLLDELAPYISKNDYDRIYFKYNQIIEEHTNVS